MKIKKEWINNQVELVNSILKGKHKFTRDYIRVEKHNDGHYIVMLSKWDYLSKSRIDVVIGANLLESELHYFLYGVNAALIHLAPISRTAKDKRS